MISMQEIPKSLQTSGIFGFVKFPEAFSAVTTVSLRAFASAITTDRIRIYFSWYPQGVHTSTLSQSSESEFLR